MDGAPSTDNLTLWVLLVLTVFVSAQAFFVMGLTRTIALIRLRLGPEARPAGLLQEGGTAPDLRRTDSRTNEPVRLDEILSGGRAAVVAFVSPTCSACVNHLPRLNALAEHHADVAFIAVVEEGNGFDFAADLSPAIKMVTDSGRLLQAAFDVRLFPHLAVIDGEGRLVAQGVSDAGELEPLLQTLRVSTAAHRNGSSPSDDDVR